jgi:hypothetical protein
MIRFHTITLILLFWLNGTAQEVKFSATITKNRAAVGEQLRLTYSINVNANGFNGPDLNAFNVYSGPNQSSSVQIINGSVSQAFSYYYIISGKKEGDFTIPPATIQIGNGRIQSNSIDLKILKGNPATTQQQQGGQRPGNGQPQQQTPATASGDNLFIRAILNKATTYLGEQFSVTYKIYSKYNQINFSDLKFPTFNGFYTEEIPMGKNDKLQVENYNGSTWYTAELKKTLLFPQKSGKLEIPTLDATCLVRERVQSQSIFDQFFGGGFKDSQVKVKSKPLTVDVLPTPPSGKPADFKGAIGQLSFTAKLDKNVVKSGDAVNLKLTISGKGNLKLIENLKPEFAPEFEVYDPQTKDNISVNESGMSGSRIFEYLIIPRAGGDFSLGPFSFSYFDPIRKSYQTLTVPRLSLKVEKTAGDQPFVNRSGSASSPKQLATDIRFNKTNQPEFSAIDSTPFFLSAGFWFFSAFSPLAMILLFLFRRKKEDRLLNHDRYRVKEAGSMAHKRLKKSNELLKSGDKDSFYEEVFKAMYGYLSDKLQIPVSELSRERIQKQLLNRKVPETIVDELLTLLDSCEFARFAPGASSEMQQVYSNSVSLLTQTEQFLKS